MSVFEDFKFAYKTTKFYAKSSEKNTNFNISKTFLCKVGISNSLHDLSTV